MKTKALNFLKFIIGWPLSLIALFFIFRLVSPSIGQIKDSLASLNIFFLFLSILCFLGYYLLRTILWHQLLKKSGAFLHLRETVYLWSISELNRYIPGNVWSFLSRGAKFGEKKIAQKVIAASLLQETLFILAGALLIFLLALPFMHSIEAIQIFANVVPDALLAVIILGSVAVLILQTYLVARLKILERLFKDLSHSFETNVIFLVLSTLGLFFFGFGYYFAVSAVSPLPADAFIAISSFAVVSLLVGYLSFITPAGLGVREGFFAIGLASFMTVPLAGFAALFARMVLIGSEVLFVALARFWTSPKFKFLHPSEALIKSRPQEVLLAVSVAAYSVYVSIASVARYTNFNTGRFDLGNMVQTVWNTSQGKFFMLTDPNGTENISRLAFHSDFILVFFAPIYAVLPHPAVLLVSQAVIVALGAVFLFGIGKILFKNRWAALLLALAYLINPSLIRANLYDFHAVVLATTFFLGAWYFYLRRSYLWLVIFLLLAAITKEQVWAVTAIFGAYMALAKIVKNFRKVTLLNTLKSKEFILGFVIFVFSVATFYLMFSYFIPQARSGLEHFAIEFYGDFGSSPSEVVISAVSDPLKVVNLLGTEGRLTYLKMLFLPVGFLPLLSPFVLFFITPDLTINLLSSNPNLQQIYYQYTAIITPFLFIASAYSIVFLNRVWPRVKIIYLSVFLLVFAVFGTYLYGPLPGSKNPNTAMFDEKLQNREEIHALISTIPHQARVAATNNAGSHLSEREHITTIPLGINEAEYVVFIIDPHETRDLGHKEEILRLMNNPNYILIKELDNFYMFYRTKYLVQY